MTLVFAIVFTVLQAVDYHDAEFAISNGEYKTCFYFAFLFDLQTYTVEEFICRHLVRLHADHNCEDE